MREKIQAINREIAKLRARMRKAHGFQDATYYANQARIDELNRELYRLKSANRAPAYDNFDPGELAADRWNEQYC